MPPPFVPSKAGEDYTRRVLKIKTRVTITRIAPMAITTQTHTGVAGGAGGAAGAGGAG